MIVFSNIFLFGKKVVIPLCLVFCFLSLSSQDIVSSGVFQISPENSGLELEIGLPNPESGLKGRTSRMVLKLFTTDEYKTPVTILDDNFNELQYSFTEQFNFSLTPLDGDVEKSFSKELTVNYDPFLSNETNRSQAVLMYENVEKISLKLPVIERVYGNLFFEVFIEYYDYYVPNPLMEENGFSIGFNGDKSEIYFSIGNDGNGRESGIVLDWLFVDGLDIADDDFHSAYETKDFQSLSVKPASQLNYSFEKNSTSIYLTKNGIGYFYSIRNHFGIGFLLSRYRYYYESEEGDITYSSWWPILDNSKVSSFPEKLEINNDDAKGYASQSYMYSGVYSENGRINEAVTYFDGFNKERQKLVYSNTNRLPIVNEILYDNFGRKVGTTLAAPVFGNSLNFQSEFIKMEGGNPFDPTEDVGGFEESTSQVSVFSDLGKFYSLDSENDNNLATTNYGYSLTRFENSTKSRPVEMITPGEVFHEGVEENKGRSKFFYAKPVQEELDRIFGTAVGKASFYDKIIHQDPNGQKFIEYRDDNGNIIASGIFSEPDGTQYIGDDNVEQIIIDVKDVLEGQKNIEAYSVLNSTELFVPTDGENYEFDYSLLYKDVLDLYCEPNSFCVKCPVQVQITITNRNGIEVPLNHNGEEKNKLIFEFDNLDESCEVFTGILQANPEVFSVENLDQGTYQINRVFSLSTSQIEEGFEEFYERNFECAFDIDQWIEEEKAIVEKSDCETINCGDLLEKPTINSSAEEIRSYYYTTMTCNNSGQTECEFAVENMKRDITPVSGQYARTVNSHFSIFNTNESSFYGVFSGQNVVDDFPLNDLDGEGVFDSQDNIDFVFNNWKDEYSDVLVKAHPEYPCLDYCIDELWEYQELFVNVKNFNHAYKLGLIETVNNLYQLNFEIQETSEPYFPDPIYSILGEINTQWQADFIQELRDYISINGNTYSLLEFVCAINWFGEDYVGQMLEVKNNLQQYLPSINGESKNCFPEDRFWMLYKSIYTSHRFKYKSLIDENNPCFNTIWSKIQEHPEYSSTENPTLKEFFFNNGLIQRWKPFNVNSILEENGLNIPEGFPDNTDDFFSLSDELNDENGCTNYCETQADYWMQSLSGCYFTQQEFAILRQELITICKDGCEYNPYTGARNKPGGASFETKVYDLFSSTGKYGKLCNGVLITDPKSWDDTRIEPNYSPAIDTCVCNAYLTAKFEFDNYTSPNYDSFGKYLESIYGQEPNDPEYLACGCLEVYEQEYGDWDYFEPQPWTDAGQETLRGHFGYLTTFLPETTCDYCITCTEVKEGYEIAQAEWENDLIAPSNVDPILLEITREKYLTNRFNGLYKTRFLKEEIKHMYSRCNNMPPPVCNYDNLLVKQLNVFFATIGANSDFMKSGVCLCESPYESFAANEPWRKYGNRLASFVETGFEREFCGHVFNYLGFNNDKYQAEIYSGGQGPCSIEVWAMSQDEKSLLNNLYGLKNLIPIPVEGEDETYRFRALAKVFNGEEFVQIQVEGETSCFLLGTCSSDPDIATFCEGQFQELNEAVEDPNPCDTEYENEVHERVQERIQDKLAEMKTYYQNLYLGCFEFDDDLNYSMSVLDFPMTLKFYDINGFLVKTVPPKGFVPFNSSTELYNVKVNRSNGEVYEPNHLLESLYNYDANGNVTSSYNPDKVENYSLKYSEIFEYDSHGKRLIKKGNANNKEGNFCYDNLGRIKLQFNEDQLSYTLYDEPHLAISSYFGENGQENLRNRVSAIFTLYDQDPSSIDCEEFNGQHRYDYATFYSYDEHGNVKKIVHDYVFLGGHNYWKFPIEYKYDQLSGKVKEVHYGFENIPGEFFHKYEYDDDDRLIEVFTSSDGVIWNKDQAYQYDILGRKRREEIGERKVQGVDYAYTHNGWLKGLNGVTEGIFDSQDLGFDYINSAKDAFSLKLDYYNGDYIVKGENFFSQGLNVEQTTDLYNGNIKAQHNKMYLNPSYTLGLVQNSIPTTNKYKYRYDQLNRLRKMWDYSTMNEPEGLAASGISSSYTYDENGNLLTLKRRAECDGLNLMYDDLAYEINPANNRLEHVIDNSGEGFCDDLNEDLNLFVGEYSFGYDNEGNLSKETNLGDLREMDVSWREDGKIREIRYHVVINTDPLETEPMVMEFKYDSFGNRIYKRVRRADQPEDIRWNSEITVRDAAGNALAMYDRYVLVPEPDVFEDHLLIKNLIIYGDQRLGIQKPIFGKNAIVTRYTNFGYDTNSELIRFGGETKFNFNNQKHFWYSGVFPNIKFYGNSMESKMDIGLKRYELKNHLGNVQSVISDRKAVEFEIVGQVEVGGEITIPPSLSSLSYKFSLLSKSFIPEVIQATDYYPFGSIMPGRSFSSPEYRYGYQGSEKDDEIAGSGNSYTTHFRQLDPRLGRWWGVDPKAKMYPNLSPYMSMNGNPIKLNDPKGDDPARRAMRYAKKHNATSVTSNKNGHWYVQMSRVVKNDDGEDIVEISSKVFKDNVFEKMGKGWAKVNGYMKNNDVFGLKSTGIAKEGGLWHSGLKLGMSLNPVFSIPNSTKILAMKEDMYGQRADTKKDQILAMSELLVGGALKLVKQFVSVLKQIRAIDIIEKTNTGVQVTNELGGLDYLTREKKPQNEGGVDR